ncbi:MAG: SpoIIIAH-like family protein, partial [Clostridia bacterium]|nr:SpoIIIAH-like family protein [Clostridia bacterium]
MSTKSGFESVKEFFQKIGRRNLVIAGAVALIVAAVAVNWIIFRDDGQDDGYKYDASAGMSTNYGTNLTTGTVGDETSKPTGGEVDDVDSYFSTVEVSRQRARDEALEVLNAVVENHQASEEVKAEALAEIQTIAKEMSQESN